MPCPEHPHPHRAATPDRHHSGSGLRAILAPSARNHRDDSAALAGLRASALGLGLLAALGLASSPAALADSARLHEPRALEQAVDAHAPLRLSLPDDILPRTAAPQAWAPPDEVPGQDGLALSVENAVFLALRNNRALAVEQLQPAITGSFEAVERAVFDPVIFAEISSGREESLRQLDQVGGEEITLTERDRFETGLRQSLPTGTDIELSLRGSRNESTRTREQFSSRAGISLTQALLRGGRLDANLARLRQARLDTQGSLYEFRGFVEQLVADVEDAYWEFVLAQGRVAIFEESLNVASQQLEETRQRIRVGQRAETEETAALAEQALRRQGLIDARSELARARIRLLRLINPEQARWDTPLQALDIPDLEPLPLEPVADWMTLAIEFRPALNEARLRIQRGDLEVIRTRQGLLPRLDLFITLGESGYASSFSDAWRDIDGPGYDYSVGLRLEHPLGNRAARAESTRAVLSRQQSLEALGNLEQLTALDVQNAWFEASRSREQIQATSLTRQLQEEVLRTEQVRFRVGSGTALAVSQAQRDLLESRLDQIEAVIRHRQALTALYRQSGSLLLHRGIEAPGEQMPLF